MEQWITFVQDRWIVLAVAAVALFVTVKIVKTFVRWVIILAIVGGIVMYGANYADQIKEVGGSLVSGVKQELVQEAIRALAGEDATYAQNPDGTFRVTKGAVTLEGKIGSSDARITYMGQSISLKIDEALQALIEQAKKNAGSN